MVVEEWVEEAAGVCAGAVRQCDAGICASNGAECIAAGDDEESCSVGPWL